MRNVVGWVLVSKSMQKSISVLGGIPGKLVGNTSMNSDTTVLHSIGETQPKYSNMSQVR